MRIPRRFAGRDELTCRRAVELITDYLEDALPARQRAGLERHLSRCANCAEYLVQLKATIAATGRIDAAQLSPDVRQTLIQLYRQSRE